LDPHRARRRNVVHSADYAAAFFRRFWPLAESYHYNPAEFEVTLGLTLLNIFYVAMALAAAWSCRVNPGLTNVVFIFLRTAFLTQLQTCEPRYVLVCFPALLAIAALLWRHSQTKRSGEEIVIA